MSRPGAGRVRRLGGLQFEITSSLFVVMLTGLAVVATVTGALAARTVERSALDRLRADARHLERMRAVASLRLADLGALARTLRGASGAAWVVVDEGGRLVGGGAPPLPRDELGPLLELARTRGEVVRRGGFAVSDLLIVVPLAPLRGEDGALLGTVPRSARLAELLPLLESGALALAVAATVFVAFGAYLLGRRIVRPVRSLSAATRRLAEGDLTVRTDVSGSDELAELAQSFNAMAESLAREQAALTRAHDSLSRSQRLAAVGQLAAGVAHEVGNPVAAILGYAEVMLRDRALSDRSREAAGRVRDEALRVRGLVRELLDRARERRSQPLELSAARPEALLRGVAERLAPQELLAGVALSVGVGRELPDLYTDVRHVERILVNLIENAAQAVRGRADARIELRADADPGAHASRRRDDPPELRAAALRRPDALTLAVIDNGPGIDPEALPQVFDPFYTTKDPDVGTGLGLWNAHCAAELVGGRLEVESAPGRTCFRLALPAVARTAAESAADTEGDSGSADGPAAHPDHR